MQKGSVLPARDLGVWQGGERGGGPVQVRNGGVPVFDVSREGS